jgi:hypothetical protein
MLRLVGGCSGAAAGRHRSPSLAMGACLLALRAASGLRSEVTSLGWQAMHGPDMLEAMP